LTVNKQYATLIDFTLIMHVGEEGRGVARMMKERDLRVAYRFVDTGKVYDGEGDDVKILLFEGLSRYDRGAHHALLRLHHLVEIVDHLLDLVDAAVGTEKARGRERRGKEGDVRVVRERLRYRSRMDHKKEKGCMWDRLCWECDIWDMRCVRGDNAAHQGRVRHRTYSTWNTESTVHLILTEITAN
jgi:hypothetical protein